MQSFILQNNDGSPLDLYQYQGDKNLLLIFFRGVWCNVCKKQLKELNENFERIEKELNTKMVAISSDTKLKSSLLKTFLRLNFPVLADETLTVINAFKIETEDNGRRIAKPSVFLISPSHEIIYQYVGQEYDDRLTAKEIIANIKKSLNKPL